MPLQTPRSRLRAHLSLCFRSGQRKRTGFAQKYGEVSFNTIEQALNESAGWDAIAGKADWGLFKFAHTHPNKSNSGLVSLFIMAYDYHKKVKGLVMKTSWTPAFKHGSRNWKPASTSTCTAPAH